MNHGQNVRRYKANPIEIGVLSIITLVFCNSLYNLLYSPGKIDATALSPMASNPTSEGRHLASVSQGTLNSSVDIQCEMNPQKTVQSSKVRILGPLCGAKNSAENLTHAEVINTTNQFHATVFNNTESVKFSTDYIPLVVGPNLVHLEFAYGDGKKLSQEVMILRNP